MAVSTLRFPDPAASELALVERAIGGDEQAFTALYRRHAAYVAGVVYRILGRDADLDDIVQEAFVEGLGQLARLEDRSKLRPYLVTIAVRRIHARLSLRYRLKSLASALFGSSPTVSDPAAREPVHDLYRALERVAPRHRVAWVLHRVEGYTLPETAELAGASLATVKRWIADIDGHAEDVHAPQ